jgi:hypothetical protein
MTMLAENFWDASVEDMMRGYVANTEKNELACLLCGKRFERGTIYQNGPLFYDADKSMAVHCEKEHSSIFDYLLNLDRKFTGLTDHTRTLLHLFYEGYSDNDIVKELGGGSTSTIRNHRFMLREREKQARVFCAIMGLLEKRRSQKQKFIAIHRTATMVDERYAITEEERDEILKAHLGEGLEGPLVRFPKKEKKKIAILTHIAAKFESGRRYTEREVNEILMALFHDHVTLRRYLIEYGFMDRERDGSQYWIKV